MSEIQNTFNPDDIIPRFEWRTFDISKEEGQKYFSKDDCYRSLESQEIYILSELSNDNIKLRFEFMDMKLPLRVNENKLELWTVALKAPFPLSIHNLALLFKGLELPLPKLNQNEFSKEEFFEIIKSYKELHLVTVSKIRHGFRPVGVRSELAEIIVNNKPYYTVSFENEDQNKVWDLVKEHGLTLKQNTNYIKFLKEKINLKY